MYESLIRFMLESLSIHIFIYMSYVWTMPCWSLHVNVPGCVVLGVLWVSTRLNELVPDSRGRVRRISAVEKPT